jgi:hypothetical protein
VNDLTMEPANKKRILLSTGDLGGLRTRPGIIFSWIDSPTKTNLDIGRVYFPGFTLGTERNDFKVGDIIKIKTKMLNEDRYQILSTFQATKSFTGLCYGKRSEIQKRGVFCMCLWPVLMECVELYSDM